MGECMTTNSRSLQNQQAKVTIKVNMGLHSSPASPKNQFLNVLLQGGYGAENSKIWTLRKKNQTPKIGPVGVVHFEVEVEKEVAVTYGHSNSVKSESTSNVLP